MHHIQSHGLSGSTSAEA